jgi:acylphosphatase
MKTVKAKINGTVQGVFFRAFVKEAADKLGLKGHVRNMEDGSVEVVAEGRDEAVNELIEICKKGNPHSMIKSVDVEEMNHQDLKDFSILRG